VRFSLVSLLLVLLLMGCGEPLRLPAGTPSVSRTPLIGQALQRTATALARQTGPASVTSAPASPSVLPTTAMPVATTGATGTSPATEQVMPSIVPTATAPSATPAVVIVPATPEPRTSEERWRAQQIDRQVLEEKPLYTARQPVPLLWWDPNTAQVVEIGLIRGDFPVQATFTFRPTGQQALEVPYRINGDFGLTAISGALRERMAAAGYTEFAETFVLSSAAVQPQALLFDQNMVYYSVSIYRHLADR
jgi:phosphopantothenoylcysteine synthetase/decarboxylase